MIKKKSLLSIIVVFITQVVFGQTSIIQDKNGETSLVMSDKKVVFFNAGDADATINMSFNKPNWFIGGNAKIKSTEGTSSLLDGYKFEPEIDLGLFGGKYLKASDSLTHFIYFGIKLINTNYNILRKDSSNTFDKSTFTGYTATFGYNRLGSINVLRKDKKIASSYILGINAQYGLINNLSDLDKVELYKSNTVISSNTTTLLQDKKAGFSGDYFSSSAFRINIDVYIFPQILGGQIGMGGYSRSQFTGNKPRNNAGIGVLFGKKGAPSNIVLGLMYQFNDIFNQLNKENSFLKRGGINIIAGYTF